MNVHLRHDAIIRAAMDGARGSRLAYDEMENASPGV